MKESLIIPDLAQEILNTSTEGIEQLTQKLSSLLSLPVFITDPHYHFLATASPAGEEKVESVLAIQQLEQMQTTHAFTCNIMTMEEDHVGIGSSILYDKKTLGYLFIVDKTKTANLESLGTLLVFAASLTAIQLYKKLEIRQEKMKFKETFLFDLLFGNMKQKADIIEYGNIWGWDFNHPQTTLVFSLTDFNHVATDKQVIHSFHYLVERILIERNGKPIAMKRQNQIIVIFITEDTGYSVQSQIETIASLVLKQMTTLHPERQFACGIGKTYKSPVDLFRSYQEAKVALELGVLLEIPLPFFTDLGLERILYKHDLQELKEYYEATLGDLSRYDEDNKTNLMETLEVFAANQYDMTSGSKALFLHRNTLRYRLKKIEEILNIKLEDHGNKLDIIAAFKIKQLRKI